jgi:pterin-4a-carbinolamine dehydratase
MKLTRLHEAFLESARRPASFGLRLPVVPRESDVPLIPTEKWKKVESPVRLRKTYRFIDQDSRNRFVMGLMEYETKTQHNATIIVTEGEVTVEVRTKDVDQVTELDKEYANWSDELYRDVVYSRPDV